jgi:hypothetical protein
MIEAPRTYQCLGPDCAKTAEGTTYRIPNGWAGDPPRCRKCHSKRRPPSFTTQFAGVGTFGRLALKRKEAR